MKQVVALVAIAALAACGDGSASTTTTSPSDDTTTSEASEAEALVLYSGRNENFVEPVIEAFTAETGIEVDVRYAGTGELATTILAEGEDTPADVFWAQDPAFIGGIAKEGLLDELPGDIASLVQDRFRDAENRWVGITGRSRVFVYNTDLVAEDDLPETVWDLAEPEWNARFGSSARS